MDAGLAILIFIAFAMLIAVGAYFAHLQAKQRREDLGALAQRIGWLFTADRDYAHEHEYDHFEIFRQGHSRFAYNTLTGVVEIENRPCDAKIGDYHYQITTSTGKQTTTHTYRFSYLIVHLPYGPLPTLLIRREGMFDAIKNAFGFADIDFESAEFSQRFYVKSSDKRFAYDVIHAPVIDYLLASDAPTIDIEEGRCCVADGNDTWSPEEFEARLRWLRRFFDLWPRHVITSLADRVAE